MELPKPKHQIILNDNINNTINTNNNTNSNNNNNNTKNNTKNNTLYKKRYTIHLRITNSLLIQCLLHLDIDLYTLLLNIITNEEHSINNKRYKPLHSLFGNVQQESLQQLLYSHPTPQELLLPKNSSVLSVRIPNTNRDLTLTDIYTQINSRDPNGRTPLHIAACKGYADFVEELFRVPDINPNLKDNNGNTPLQALLASDLSTKKKVAISKILRAHGAR